VVVALRLLLTQSFSS